jgi:hypothetical protein
VNLLGSDSVRKVVLVYNADVLCKAPTNQTVVQRNCEDDSFKFIGGIDPWMTMLFTSAIRAIIGVSIADGTPTRMEGFSSTIS